MTQLQNSTTMNNMTLKEIRSKIEMYNNQIVKLKERRREVYKALNRAYLNRDKSSELHEFSGLSTMEWRKYKALCKAIADLEAFKTYWMLVDGSTIEERHLSMSEYLEGEC